jgi:Ser/Thr protein kinase RdoA (MazF antagonist)
MGRQYKRLKAAAHELDRRLRGHRPDAGIDPRFRTLVHGDFKSANLLFSMRPPVSCAAFDFQYCGEGDFLQNMFVLQLQLRIEKQRSVGNVFSVFDGFPLGLSL